MAKKVTISDSWLQQYPGSKVANLPEGIGGEEERCVADSKCIVRRRGPHMSVPPLSTQGQKVVG